MMRVLRFVACLVLITSGELFAQSTSTFNGRVLDQGEAVLPGVTVTATHQATGVARTTVSNAEGLYFLPGLDPGVYDITTELPGFAPSTRNGVTLGVNATITLDFKLGLAGVNEAVTVTGAAPLIEVTQSKVASSIDRRDQTFRGYAHRQRQLSLCRRGGIARCIAAGERGGPFASHRVPTLSHRDFSDIATS